MGILTVNTDFEKLFGITEREYYAKQYLTFECDDEHYVWDYLELTIPAGLEDNITSISYSIDGGVSWTTMDYENEEIVLMLTDNPVDRKVLFKGIAKQYYNETLDEDVYAEFSSDVKFKVYGNIMSLFYGDDFEDKVVFPSNSSSNCARLFYNWDVLVDAENLILPATTLTEYCYNSMFESCTSLTSAPELPATTLAQRCYFGMFGHCSALTTAPELPATTLANYCYYNMFMNCTSLISTPELPATTLASSCYSNMFYGCTSLTTVPELPATTLAQRCYFGMFGHCSALTTAPELPATTLAQICYNSMFNGCTSLNNVKCHLTGNIDSSNTDNWLKDVASTGTFICDFNSTWTDGASGIPTGWAKKYFELPTPQYGVTISPDTRSFVGEMEVFLSSQDIKVSGIKYTTDGTEPNAESPTYNGSFVLTDTTTIKAASFNTDGEEYKFGPTSSATFTKVTPSLFAYVDKFPAYKDVDDPDYDNNTDLDYINFFDMTRSEFIAAVAADPEQYKSDKYYYAGDTIEYDGVIYNVWGYMNDPDKAEWMFMWTTTADYSTLNQQSIATSGENAEFTALYTFASNGEEPNYNNADVYVPRQLVKIIQAS